MSADEAWRAFKLGWLHMTGGKKYHHETDEIHHKIYCHEILPYDFRDGAVAFFSGSSVCPDL